MREARIEAKLKSEVERIGGLCWKWVSPGTAGVPDRIVILPGGRTIYIELKAPGEKPRSLQRKRHQQLRDRGHDVRVIDSIDGVAAFIREVADHAI